MNILFVIPTLDTGGAQTFFTRLVPCIQRAGHNVVVYEMSSKVRNQALYNVLIDQGIKVYGPPTYAFDIWLDRNKINAPINLINKIYNRLNLSENLERLHLRKICRNNKIEIVNSHMYLADLFAVRMLGNLKNLKIVSSFHGCYSLIQQGIKEGRSHPEYANLFMLHLRQIFSRLDAFVYLTQHQLKFPDFIDVSKVVHKKIYNGFISASIKQPDLSAVEVEPSKNFSIGMVARGDKAKGWEELIIAFKRFVNQNQIINCKLILVGGGNYIDVLKSKYPDPRIIFIGAVAEPLPYINEFDIAVLPTYFAAESLPNSIIEYLYAGKPVIATNVAEIPLMLKNSKGEDAGVVISLDQSGKADIVQLVKALEYYYTNSQIRVQHSIVAKEAYKKFDLDECVNKYLQFFEEINNKK